MNKIKITENQRSKAKTKRKKRSEDKETFSITHLTLNIHVNERGVMRWSVDRPGSVLPAPSALPRSAPPQSVEMG